MKYYCYFEPWTIDGKDYVSVKVCMSREDAIRWARSCEPRHTDDEEALLDFIAIHWAVEEEHAEAP